MSVPVMLHWSVSPNVNTFPYQEAVEELMHKEAQDADNSIAQMVYKEHVHNNCFVASSERSLVSHKTHEKDYFVEQLEEKNGLRIKKRQQPIHLSYKQLLQPSFTYIDSTQQQQSRAKAHRVDST